MLNVKKVAVYLLDYAYQSDDSRKLISNLKLQKLLYYAQGNFLALHGERLFDANIEAWQHGPVVREIYFEFRHHENQNIPRPTNIDYNNYSPMCKTFLGNIVDTYGLYSAWELRDMTHSESPWMETQERGVIHIDKLRQHFADIVPMQSTVADNASKDWADVAKDILERRHSLWEKLAKV